MAWCTQVWCICSICCYVLTFNSSKESKQLLVKQHREVIIIISVVIFNAQARLITPSTVKFNALA